MKEKIKRRVRRRFWMRWAATYAGLQVAPWFEFWAHDAAEAKAELNRIAARNGYLYGQTKYGNERAKKNAAKTK